MLKILFASSEVQPLMKTGGLADVSGALPIALKKMRQDVRIIMPAYRSSMQITKRTKLLARLQLPGIMGEIGILGKKLPDSNVEVLFVDYAPAFDRDGNPYVDADGNPWADNAERFSLFCRAICEIAQDRAGLNWRPDIVHCNDWQSGLVPALLQQEKLQSGGTRPATVFTIHNLAYQGLFSQQTFNTLGLPTQLWSPQALEFHNQLSFIKGGIVFADRITTVSPRYATEIQSSEFGYGLEGLLTYRKDKLTGIVNGIDDSEWDPANDPHLEIRYSADTLTDKKNNKRFLQGKFNLPEDSSVLLLGFIGRLVEQKGVDLIIDLLPKLATLPVQLVLLGTGNKKFERELQALAGKYPEKFSCTIGYNEALSHQIEAGCDVFLMPSRFEPCGLNQLYSLRYGTLPIVNKVGGLADTIINLDQQHTNLNEATGLIMQTPGAESLYQQIVRAINLFQDPDKWQTVMTNGMRKNFSWQKSAAQYLDLYKAALQDQRKISQ